MNQRDPLEELRENWRNLDPRLPEESSRIDPRTRATLQWLKDSWRVVEPRAIPGRRARARRRWSRRLGASETWRTALPLAAAAALVFSITRLWSQPPFHDHAPAHGGATEVSLEIPSHASSPPPSLKSLESVRELADLLVLNQADRVELESGDVRLILAMNPILPEQDSTEKPR